MAVKLKLVLKDGDAKKFLGSLKVLGDRAKKSFSEELLKKKSGGGQA